MTTTRAQGYVAAGACVDEHTLDQLVIYMALAQNHSVVKGPARAMISSLHVQTAVEMSKFGCKWVCGEGRVGSR